MHAMGLNTLRSYNKIFYKTSKNSKKKKYKKEDIAFFVVKNNFDKNIKFTYVQKSKRKSKLMQVLVEGKVSLYAERGVQEVYEMSNSNFKYYMDQDYYYVKKGNEIFVDNRFFTNIFKSFRKTAKAYFFDCNLVVSKIENGEYKANDLEEIIKEYNSCFN